MAVQRFTERDAVTVAEHPVGEDHVRSHAARDLDGALQTVGLDVAVAADLEDKAIELACVAVVVHDENDGESIGRGYSG